MADSNEDRKFPRIPTNLVAHCRKVDTRALMPQIQGTVKNVSRGGVFIETLEPHELGEFLEVIVQFPNDPTPSTILGVVRWKGDSPVGVGLEVMMVEHAEKRKYPRMAVDRVTSIRRQTEDSGPGRQAIVKDVSLGGVYIETNSIFRVGEMVSFPARALDEDDNVELRGVIRWVSLTPPGIGVEVVQDDLHHLEEVLADDLIYNHLVDLFKEQERHILTRQIGSINPSSAANDANP